MSHFLIDAMKTNRKEKKIKKKKQKDGMKRQNRGTVTERGWSELSRE